MASVILKANVNAPTQFAQLRVTDLTSGQQLTGNFLIQQVTDGSKILTVVPERAPTITAAFKGECSTGFPTDYYIYGGTPPYRVTSTFPAAVTLLNSTVNVERRVLRGHHQRHLRRSADVLDRRRDGPADDGDADQRGRHGGSPRLSSYARVDDYTDRRSPWRLAPLTGGMHGQDVPVHRFGRHAALTAPS